MRILIAGAAGYVGSLTVLVARAEGHDVVGLNVGRFAQFTFIVDVACSPRPVRFDPSDPAHCRMRNTGSLLLNWFSLPRACAWNMAVLPKTLKSRRRDRTRIAVARRALSDELQRRKTLADGGDKHDAPNTHESVTIREPA